jgi:hypothetical protein
MVGNDTLKSTAARLSLNEKEKLQGPLRTNHLSKLSDLCLLGRIYLESYFVGGSVFAMPDSRCHLSNEAKRLPASYRERAGKPLKSGSLLGINI